MAVIKLHQNRVNPLVLPVILADQLGMFKKQQVTVDLRLAETFQFNGKSEFMTGEVDAMMGDTTFFFYYLKDGKYAKITSNLTRTIQIVGNQDVKAERHLFSPFITTQQLLISNELNISWCVVMNKYTYLSNHAILM